MNLNDTGHVFVYGSLKKGETLYYLEPLMELRLEVWPGRIRDAVLYDLGPFPGLILKADGGTVSGEVHRFSNLTAILEILDEAESYYGESDPDNLYRRVHAKAEVDGGRFVACWLYEYVGPLEGASLIENGMWHGIGT